jgi:hypothetical protein
VQAVAFCGHCRREWIVRVELVPTVDRFLPGEDLDPVEPLEQRHPLIDLIMEAS